MIQQKYLCTFVLHRRDADSPSRLICRVKWNGSRAIVDLNVGFQIDPEKWDKNTQRCMLRSVHGKRRIPAQKINAEINRFADIVSDLFEGYGEDVPEVDKVRRDLRLALGIDTKTETGLTFRQAYDRYLATCSKENAWTSGTMKTLASIGRRLEDSGIFASMEDFTRANLERLVEWMREDRDLADVTIHRQLQYVRWFCHWAEGAGLLSCRDYELYKPKIKQAQKPVIYLTWDELMKVYCFKGSAYQERVRDVFLFCAFTSLRYSDAMALQWANVHEDHITVVTQKTGDPLIIELNDYSREVLERCRSRRTDDRVLPHYANQVMNRELKEIMKECGIDEPVKVTSFRGGERVDIVRPKYEMVGTHAARRTFICNALMMGISPVTVMQWTGHSDYDSMKPYIAIADKARAQAMSLFNRKK